MNFTGEIVLADAENGTALVLATHEDGHKAYFQPEPGGWELT